jgi:hypothetical protein
MMALRLLAVASSKSLDVQYLDEELLVKAVRTRMEVELEISAMDILVETLKTSVNSLTRVVKANEGEQYPPRSLVHTLAQHKMRILTECQQWAQSYRNTLIIPPV